MREHITSWTFWESNQQDGPVSDLFIYFVSSSLTHSLCMCMTGPVFLSVYFILFLDGTGDVDGLKGWWRSSTFLSKKQTTESEIKNEGGGATWVSFAAETGRWPRGHLEQNDHLLLPLWDGSRRWGPFFSSFLAFDSSLGMIMSLVNKQMKWGASRTWPPLLLSMHESTDECRWIREGNV